MPIMTSEIHTFTCSSPDCDFSRTLTGEVLRLQRELIAVGWSFNNIIIDGVKFDLCPTHNKELRRYFGLETASK